MCDYGEVIKKCRRIEKNGAKLFSIGQSVQGRDIVCLEVGNGQKTAIITGAIHAREHAAATLVLMQAEYALSRLKKGEGKLYFIACVNPDGAEIACGKQNPPRFYEGDARLYKANARGVDLNVNFDAGWSTGAKNVFAPGGENYVGKSPFSEPETRALRDFTMSVLPDFTISYHLKGREIYYDFRCDAETSEKYLKTAEKANRKLRYKIVADNGVSAGGYKDWCIQKLKIPALTIEIGKDELTHPVSEEKLTEDYARNLDLPLIMLR